MNKLSLCNKIVLCAVFCCTVWACAKVEKVPFSYTILAKKTNEDILERRELKFSKDTIATNSNSLFDTLILSDSFQLKFVKRKMHYSSDTNYSDKYDFRKDGDFLLLKNDKLFIDGIFLNNSVTTPAIQSETGIRLTINQGGFLQSTNEKFIVLRAEYDGFLLTPYTFWIVLQISENNPIPFTFCDASLQNWFCFQNFESMSTFGYVEQKFDSDTIFYHRFENGKFKRIMDIYLITDTITPRACRFVDGEKNIFVNKSKWFCELEE